MFSTSGYEALLRKVGGVLDILGQVYTSQVCWFQYRVQVRHGRVTSSTTIRAAVKLAGWRYRGGGCGIIGIGEASQRVMSKEVFVPVDSIQGVDMVGYILAITRDSLALSNRRLHRLAW